MIFSMGAIVRMMDSISLIEAHIASNEPYHG